MDSRYEKIQELSSGSFGVVWKGMNKETGEVVAIKNLNRLSSTEYINIMRRMNHPYIVKLKEVITKENNSVFLVFEYMESNLHQVIKHRKTLFSESEIRNWMFQVFQGLAYIHQRGQFHGDLKPNNLFVSKNVIKIANLGSYSRQPYTKPSWYRAPEILLKSAICDSAVDMWAMGAIMAELFTLLPLFSAGSSDDRDQMENICSVLGTPTWSDWPGGLVLANAIHYQFPELKGGGVQLSSDDMFPTASKDARNLIFSLCSWDPLKRPTAMECLQHPFFHCSYHVPRISLLPRPATVQSKETSKDGECAETKRGNKKNHVRKDDEINMVTEENHVSTIIETQPRSEPPIRRDGPTSIYNDIIARGLSEKLSDIELALARLHAQLLLANPFTGSASTFNPKPARNCAPALLRRLELNIEDAFKNEYSSQIVA